MKIEDIIANRLEAQKDFVSENFCGLVDFYHECMYEIEESKWLAFVKQNFIKITQDYEYDDDQYTPC